MPALIRDATRGDGVDVLLEMSGAPAAIRQGFELLKPTDDRNTWLVITRWADDESFQSWVSSSAFGSGRHAPVSTVSLEITISNDAGVLGRICTLIGEQKANISDLRFTDRKPDFYRVIVDVDLRDVEHLHTVMTALEAETDVAQIARHRDQSKRP